MSTHEQKDTELVDAYPYAVWYLMKTPLLVKLGFCHSRFFPKHYTYVATVWAFSLEEALEVCTADGWDTVYVEFDDRIPPRRNTLVGDVVIGRTGTYVVTPTGFQEFDFDWN